MCLRAQTLETYGNDWSDAHLGCLPNTDLEVGAQFNADRNFHFDVVPEELVGAALFQTPHRNYAPGFIFSTSQPLMLHIWYQTHGDIDGGWRDLGGEWEHSPCPEWAQDIAIACKKRRVEAGETAIAVTEPLIGGAFATPLVGLPTSWASSANRVTPAPPVVEEVAAWTLVMQYGAEPYHASSHAIGTPSETETGAAKLSDADINGLPRGATTGGMLLQTSEPHMFTYYKLTSDKPHHSGERETLLIRTLYTYDDNDSRFGLAAGGTQFCKSSEADQSWTGNVIESPAACTRWNGILIDGHLDTRDVTGFGCARWYAGFHEQFCTSPRSSDSHCWNTGDGCGSRVNLKMYKCTGDGC